MVQRQAVVNVPPDALDHAGSPMLVLGGPGTGKTRFLEDRFLRLARDRSVAPHRILLLCSNRPYAVGARDRLARALPQDATVEVPAYTWHGLAHHLVTRYYPYLGYREMPVLLTAAEQWGVVRELLAGEDRRLWPHWGERLTERAFVDEVADFCLRVEQQLLTGEELGALGAIREDWAEVVSFFGRYSAALNQRARLDYARLIALASTLLAENEAVRDALRSRFPHVLVDDAQDLSRAHRDLLRQLEISNLVMAGDPDSGIETFRGGEPDWLFGFERQFGEVRTVVLAKGHRIGEPLASRALDLIARNDHFATHRPSTHAAHRTEFECRLYPSIAQEAEGIARELRKMHVLEDVPWDGMAVLVSQPRHLLAPLQRALELFEVPYQPLGGERALASEPSVRHFLDLVRVALDAGGAARLLPALLTSPLIGLDLATRRRLERHAWQTGQTLREVLDQAPEASELARLCEVVTKHQDRADECFWEVWSQSSYYQRLKELACSDPNDPANAAVDALVTLSRALERFVDRRRGAASIGQYLGEAARADFGSDPWVSPGPSRPGVALVSFHGSKGREWEIVVVAGCLDAWMPKGRRSQGLFDPFALQAPDVTERQLEAIADDRRTFYVAATRARKRAIFTVSPPSGGRARPSRFLFELAGEGPAEVSPGELPPLTTSELSARLRRLLSSPAATPEERIPAVIALAETPQTDPRRWYGGIGWTAGKTPIIHDGVLRTSYSRLSAFENCGLQYVLQSVLGLDLAATHSMKFGTWMHALFQAVHERRITDPRSLLAEYERIFDPAVFPNATVARQFERDGRRMLEVFWRNEVDFRRDIVAEREFEFDYGRATLRGRIDRIDRVGKVLKLTDYKTSKWAPSRVDAESSLQLAIYHLAARSVPELVQMGFPEVARLVYPGAIDRYGSHAVLSQNSEQAEKVISELPAKIEAVIGEEFNPSPEADCFFCKMKPLCPLWPEGREVATE
ncbi:MAG: ATP-dependent helicase [Actinomycetota bacterium]|nr:ATP-dependent helicase [Actinomycetota bacterium]